MGVKRKGKLREATLELIAALSEKQEELEKELELVVKEKNMLWKKLED